MAEIKHHVVSETVHVEAGGLRYRATRDAMALEPYDAIKYRPWTLWFDRHPGDSGSVGSGGQWATLEDALRAADRHSDGDPALVMKYDRAEVAAAKARRTEA